MVKLPNELLAMLRQPSICHIATLMPDGSPQLTLTWVDTDGQNVLINTVPTYLKVRNIKRDPRVALTISPPNNPWSYFQVRGRVIDVKSAGAAEHIEMLSHKYVGAPYAWYGGRDQARVIIVVEPDKISSMG